ncbi:MAG: flagellar biosynthetic protein FliO [Rhodoblastus sp.]|nr:MAG: flagellar biosynthetic protein FliO [Rhodoblastus sp.]
MENNKLLQFLVLFAGLAIATLTLYAIYRWAMGARLRPRGARGRQPRLGVVDAFDLDRQRQLVIVRRDNVEHLIMIGGPNDVVVETAIIRAQARDAGRDAGSDDEGRARGPALPYPQRDPLEGPPAGSLPIPPVAPTPVSPIVGSQAPALGGASPSDVAPPIPAPVTPQPSRPAARQAPPPDWPRAGGAPQAAPDAVISPAAARAASAAAGPHARRAQAATRAASAAAGPHARRAQAATRAASAAAGPHARRAQAAARAASAAAGPRARRA